MMGIGLGGAVGEGVPVRGGEPKQPARAVAMSSSGMISLIREWLMIPILTHVSDNCAPLANYSLGLGQKPSRAGRVR
jgi:hypothetical protein